MTLCPDDHTLACVHDRSGKAVSFGKAVNIGSEPYALHNSVNPEFNAGMRHHFFQQDYMGPLFGLLPQLFYLSYQPEINI